MNTSFNMKGFESNNAINTATNSTQGELETFNKLYTSAYMLHSSSPLCPTASQSLKKYEIINLLNTHNNKKTATMDILSLSHTDADGYISQLIVEGMNNSTVKNGINGASKLVKQVNRFIPMNFGTPQILSDYIINTLQHDVELLKSIDFIIITDLTPTNDALHTLSDIAQASSLPFVVIDHHTSAIKQLEAYEGCQDTVFVYDKDSNGVVYSATGWASYIFEPKNNCDIIKIADAWDTWKWNDIDDVLAPALNNLLYSLGNKGFKLLWDTNGLNNMLRQLVVKQIETDKVKDTVRRERLIKNGHVLAYAPFSMFVEEATIAITTGTFVSSDSEVLYEHFKCDTIIVIGLENISMRTKNSKVDLSKIASYYGGGGHSKAAGFTVLHGTDEAKSFVVDMLQYMLLSK